MAAKSANLFELFLTSADRFPSKIAVVFDECRSQCTAACNRCASTDSKGPGFARSLRVGSSGPRSGRSAEYSEEDEKNLYVDCVTGSPCSCCVTSLSYSELLSRCRLIGSILLHHCKEDGIVGYLAPVDANTPACLLGILSVNCGFAYCSDKSGALLTINRLGVKSFIVAESLAEDFANSLPYKTSAESFPGTTQLVLVSVHHPITVKQYPDLAYVITTSGSTGEPKVVAVPHSCIVPNVVELSEKFNLTSDDVVFWTSPLTFDPSVVELFTTLFSGACLLIVPSYIKMMPRKLNHALCHRHRVTVLMATPTLMQRFGDALLADGLFGPSSALRTLVLGGEACPPMTTLQKWTAGHRVDVFNIYGITELSCWATCHYIKQEEMRSDSPVPIGSPLKHVICEVRDDHGYLVTANGRGHLYIGSHKRFCYINSEAHHTRFPVMRSTGDVVSVSHEQVYYEGRTDDQVKRNGQRINLIHLEQAMLQLADVQGATAVMVGDRLILGVIGCAENVAKQHIRENLSSSYWPDSVLEVDELPMTKHGLVISGMNDLFLFWINEQF